MAEFKIRRTDTRRVVAKFRADVDPGDEAACLALLRRRCAHDGLGSADDHYIEVWDQRRGEQEYRT